MAIVFCTMCCLMVRSVDYILGYFDLLDHCGMQPSSSHIVSDFEMVVSDYMLGNLRWEKLLC